MFTFCSSVYQSLRTCRNLCLRSPCLLSTSAWGNGEFRFWTNKGTHLQMSTHNTLFQRTKITELPQLHNIRKPSIFRSSGNFNPIIMHIYHANMQDKNAANTSLILLWQVAANYFLDILSLYWLFLFGTWEWVCFLLITTHSWEHKPTAVLFTQKTFVP